MLHLIVVLLTTHHATEAKAQDHAGDDAQHRENGNKDQERVVFLGRERVEGNGLVRRPLVVIHAHEPGAHALPQCRDGAARALGRHKHKTLQVVECECDG